METRRNPTGIADELSITKAAAWAWYQRGSGSDDGSPAPEYDAARSRRPAPKPSRYKVEAIRTSQPAMEGSNSSPRPLLNPFHNEHNISHLLDRYEIERIRRQLDSFREASIGESGIVSGFVGGHRSRRGVVSQPETDMSEMKKKEKKTRERMAWFSWLRHGTTCGGSRADVVEQLTIGFRNRRPLEEHGTAVDIANRPLRNHS
ncbi:hypothetical protein U1Q18_039767 [Sarracenia purpurea var. burkii]